MYKRQVSVIVPVCGKFEVTQKCIVAIRNQTYRNIEIVIVNDDIQPILYGTIKHPIRVIENYKNDYGLARARNKGVIEATGDVLVFCDQRMMMDSKAVEKFVENLKPRSWLYGNKGVKKEFVENFSCVYRNDLIKIGMFCERMDKYGGLSQETRSRAKHNGFNIEYIDSAIATPMGKSSNKHSKKQEIIKSKNRLWKMGMEL